MKRDAFKLTPGQTFNRLTAIEYQVSVKTGKELRRMWLFQCSCGSRKILNARSVTAGYVKSCGCWAKERPRTTFKPEGYTSYRALFRSCKSSAALRKIEFNLTESEHKIIISNNCHYCGREPKSFNAYLKVGGTERRYDGVRDVSQKAVDRAWVFVNGVDRVDSNKGYSVLNCVPACSKCNGMKLDADKEDFLSHVDRISEFQRNKNAI